MFCVCIVARLLFGGGLFKWMTRVMARKLLLIRHARPEGAPTGGFLGQTDLPISSAGMDQARELSRLVRAAKPQACYCSPLLRARQTADILLKGLSLPVQIHDDLREIDFGHWECKTFEQVAAENAREIEQWAAFDHRFTFPGGESLGGFLARVRRMAKRFCEDPADVVLGVTHGGMIRSMICHLLGLRPRNYILFDVAHASCVSIDLFEGKGVLSGFNLTHATEVS
jgi:broad specificity phosphatase PhoE